MEDWLDSEKNVENCEIKLIVHSNWRFFCAVIGFGMCTFDVVI